jgi:hypothetical protein
MPFKKGQSGNPAGRRKNRVYRSEALRKIVERDGPALVQKAIALALEGDTVALKLMIDKILPNPKPYMPTTVLPVQGATPADTARKIAHHMAEGRITPEQAGAMMNTVAQMVQIVESSEIEQRLRDLEADRESSPQHAY